MDWGSFGIGFGLALVLSSILVAYVGKLYLEYMALAVHLEDELKQLASENHRLRCDLAAANHREEPRPKTLRTMWESVPQDANQTSVGGEGI